MPKTDNLRIKSIRPLILPSLLLYEIPNTQAAIKVVNKARGLIADILHGHDDRIVAVVGPCSIHDPKAAKEYASRLKTLADQYTDELCIIMRVYFEKPRTTIGWKGLINDPNLNGQFNINQGLKVARQLLLDINQLGMPTGSEFLDTMIPQYITDLTSWAAIGARTSESQVHRELASGLSMPIGFKNGTTGNVKIAADAIYAANQPHHFLSVTKEGISAIISTTGNPHSHMILRGSNTGPNYDPDSIQNAVALLDNQHLMPRLMVDCSHGNSQKDYNRQLTVLESLCEQILNGNQAIFGVMLESNLKAGKQDSKPGDQLIYGLSITDACIGWEDTEKALSMLSETVKKRRESKKEHGH